MDDVGIIGINLDYIKYLITFLITTVSWYAKRFNILYLCAVVVVLVVTGLQLIEIV